MRFRLPARALLAGAAFLATLLAQRGFREYPGEEHMPAPVPPDAYEKTEFAFARLRYTEGGFGGRGWGGNWLVDYPRADRHFVKGVRRLTRLHIRSSEQVVDLDLDDDEIYYWPWVYTLEVGYWNLTDRQTARLRDYLLRGGFLLIDDFHGGEEWEGFLYTMNRIFPDRPIVDIPKDDPIFHVLYDLDERIPVAGATAVVRGRTYERYDSQTPYWRGVYDDKGRIMVAILFNQDYGDAWERADTPWYPAKMTIQSYQIGINYIFYAMTH
jgi:hypothetical protein